MKMVIFWYLFTFAVVKFAVAVFAYVQFKAAFTQQYQGSGAPGGAMFGSPMMQDGYHRAPRM